MPRGRYLTISLPMSLAEAAAAPTAAPGPAPAWARVPNTSHHIPGEKGEVPAGTTAAAIPRAMPWSSWFVRVPSVGSQHSARRTHPSNGS